MKTNVRLALLLIMFLNLSQLTGQTIQVIDQTNLQPIEHVMVFNAIQKISAFTNQRGEVVLSSLNPTDTLIFQHASYQEAILSYATIKDNGNAVFLILRSYNLEQFTVTAHRWEQNREDISARVKSIPAREVAFQNPQTAADLLNQTNEVFVQKSQLGGGSPMIRGFATNSVLIVVDGVRMNNAIYRSGNLHNVISLDPNFIENTEVIFGPGSVIYGSDALGGVMVFHTQEPTTVTGNSLELNISPMIRYSSADNEQTAHVATQLRHKKWASVTSFTYSSFSDLRTGSRRSKQFPDFGKRMEFVRWTGTNDTVLVNEEVNLLVPSGYRQLNIAQKIRYNPSRNFFLIYGFHYSATSDIPRYDRLIEYHQGELRFAEWYYGPQQWMMHNLQIRLLNKNRFYTNGKIIAAYQFNEESRHNRRLGQMIRTNRVEKVHALILNADLKKKLLPSVDLFYGFEALYNNVISTASAINITTLAKTPASTRYPNEYNHYGSVAAYGFLKSEFSKKIILNAGIRFNRVMLKSFMNDTVYYQFPFSKIEINTAFFNGSLGLAMHPVENIQLNANLSTGFRAPNLDDAGKIFESEPGNVVVPNPELKPEYTANSEIGFIFTPYHHFRFELNAFYTLLFDVMVRRNFQYCGSDSIIYTGELSKVLAIVNAGQGEIFGLFAGFKIGMDRNFTLNSSLTYTIGREITDNGSIPLKHIPPVFGATSVIYRKGLTRIEASVVYNSVKEWEALDPSEQAKTHMYTEAGSLAWFTLNLKASYQVLSQLQLNAGIENILDKHYWPYASGIPAPGRNIYVALRGNF